MPEILIDGVKKKVAWYVREFFPLRPREQSILEFGVKSLVQLAVD